jgi:S-disulfanyl-L-cysteine oxidoreductase SoxD
MPKFLTATLTIGVLSTAAWAFPWDTDMVDAVYKRAFAWEMATLPENTISVNHARLQGNRYAAETAAMIIPDDASIEEGKQLFDIYCTACHGVDGQGKAPVVDNASGKRYPIPPPVLSGTGNVTKLRNDGYLFFTVRDGSAIMPGYGYAMMDEDVWALVAYMRTMDGAGYTAPVEVAQ